MAGAPERVRARGRSRTRGTRKGEMSASERVDMSTKCRSKGRSTGCGSSAVVPKKSPERLARPSLWKKFRAACPVAPTRSAGSCAALCQSTFRTPPPPRGRSGPAPKRKSKRLRDAPRSRPWAEGTLTRPAGRLPRGNRAPPFHPPQGAHTGKEEQRVSGRFGNHVEVELVGGRRPELLRADGISTGSEQITGGKTQ